MKRYTALEHSSVLCALALGAFDGLHLGHRAVIGAAWEPGLERAVLTFREAPSGGKLLLAGEDKARLLEEMGVCRLYDLDFPAMREMEAEDFIHTLYEDCGVRKFCCGQDFRFGRGATGDVALLQELCRELGAGLEVVPTVCRDGEKISSTRIRGLVEQGEVEQAASLLGRPLGFSAPVVHGNHLGGPVLGTPTINQPLPRGFVLPPFGVYAARGSWEGITAWGVANVGVKPTVGSEIPLAETWFPEFSGDLYGKRVHLSLLKFLRPERKFDSLEELSAEIHRNAEEARRFLRV